MPTHLSVPRTTHRNWIRSGDADGIFATIVVAGGLIVCAMTWHPPTDARPNDLENQEAARARLRASLVSFTDGLDRVTVALPDE